MVLYNNIFLTCRFPVRDQYPPKSILYKKCQDTVQLPKPDARESDNNTSESTHGQEEELNPTNVQSHYASVVKPKKSGVAVAIDHSTDNREQYDVVDVECSTEGATLSVNEYHIPDSVPSTTSDGYVDVSPYF